MLPYKRSQRVGHLLKEEVSDIVLNRVKDPRMGFLTVTDVEVADDLKLARVYVSTLKDEDRESAMEVLDSAKGFIRSELKKRLRMKTIPALEFRFDETSRYGEKMEKLFRKMRKEP
ncbi:MAG: 30S ribosome-binding factor RbfA [Nitrospirota bacterium]|jgi:ribosome-binding factor A